MIYHNAETCKDCGLCGRICPRYIVETSKIEGKKQTGINEDRADICIRCGQCLAVCPTGSLRVDGIKPDDLTDVPGHDCTPDQLMTLLQRRRSVRRYRKKPVPREVLEKVIQAVQWAPTASSRGGLNVIVVADPDVLAALQKHVYAFYEMVDGILNNPLKRWFMTRRTGSQKVGWLQHHVMPGVRWYRRWYLEGRGDEISRDAPALVLFHTTPKEPSGDESCHFAAWQAVLMAEALGLGSCVNGLIPPACNKSDEIRSLLDLPDGNEVHACLTLGWPSVKYNKTIRRQLGEARFI